MKMLAQSERTKLRRASRAAIIASAVAGGAIVLAAAALYFRPAWLASLLPTADAPAVAVDPPEAPEGLPLEVRLPEEKIRAAHLHTAEAVLQQIGETRRVPGTVTYDTGRQLELTAPVECVVKQVFVEPGQTVAKGDQLALLSSGEIGLARDDVSKHEAELALVRKERDWCEQIAANVDYLLAMFKNRLALVEVEKQLEGKPLGDYREKLVSAYSKLVLADRILNDSGALDESGAISKRLVQERRSAQEIAAATFQSACETSRFEAAQQSQKVRGSAEQAERLLAISRERLASLLGPAGATPLDEGEAYSDFLLRAPFAGHVQERQMVAAGRFTAGKPLVTIADTSSLWVSAEIHERDWRALDVAAGNTVNLRVPALKDAEFAAPVRFIGSQVSPETRSVPLVADLPNAEGQFKPGMFVWVDVPLGNKRQALVVPAGAIMRHEEQAFVFVPQGTDRFRRVDVQTGLETRETVEILSGLSTGDRVVDQGAFFLKSELLLEQTLE